MLERCRVAEDRRGLSNWQVQELARTASSPLPASSASTSGTRSASPVRYPPGAVGRGTPSRNGTCARVLCSALEGIPFDPAGETNLDSRTESF